MYINIAKKRSMKSHGKVANSRTRKQNIEKKTERVKKDKVNGT